MQKLHQIQSLSPGNGVLFTSSAATVYPLSNRCVVVLVKPVLLKLVPLKEDLWHQQFSVKVKVYSGDDSGSPWKTGDDQPMRG